MKKVVFLLFLFTFLIAFSAKPNPVHAHMPGQPPFFTINGKYSGFYPVYSSSLKDFLLPQDIGPEQYLVNKPVDFAIAREQLEKVIPYDVVNKTIFLWDFGDGEKGDGLENSHSYSKIGSYIITIHADTSKIENIPPQLLQSVLLHIVPNKDYKLPISVITANGKISTDPVTDVLTFSPQEELTFDAAKSAAPSSAIVSYFWDLGDGQTSTEKIIKHTYAPSVATAFPLLRVKDANGFIADSFVQESNDSYQIGNPLGKAKKPAVKTETSTKTPSQLPYVLSGLAIITAVFFVIKKYRKK